SATASRRGGESIAASFSWLSGQDLVGSWFEIDLPNSSASFPDLFARTSFLRRSPAVLISRRSAHATSQTRCQMTVDDSAGNGTDRLSMQPSTKRRITE